MKIRMLKSGWRRGVKPGDVIDVIDSTANMLIRKHKAEPHESVNPDEVRPAFARLALRQKQAAIAKATETRSEPDESPISEGSQPAQGGRRGGTVAKRRQQADLAAHR